MTDERLAYAKEEIHSRVQMSQLIEILTGSKLSRGKMLCPLHNEKTASFYVDDSKGVYYCQGCGAGGDAIDFTMRYSGMRFMDAITHINNQFSLGLVDSRISVASQNAIRLNKRKREDDKRLEVENKAIYDRLCLDYRITRAIVSNLEPMTTVWGDTLTRIAWLEFAMDKVM